MMAEVSTFVANPKVKIALIKAAKGYRWTVEVTDEDHEQALRILEQVESRLKALYGSAE